MNKFCVNCSHGDNKHGLCSAEQSSVYTDLVTGKKWYRSQVEMRASSDTCGPLGTWFEQKKLPMKWYNRKIFGKVLWAETNTKNS